MSHALDLKLGCAHDGDDISETWEETDPAHLDRWHFVFLDEPDAARPLGGRTCASVVEEATVRAASRENDAQIFADGNFEVFPFQLRHREARRLAWTGLDAAICDLCEMRNPLHKRPAGSSRVAFGEWISTSLCVPIAMSTHWLWWTQGTCACARSRTS